MSYIEDGTGTGHKAKVDGHNRIQTRAVTQSEEEYYLHYRQSFNVETPVITLTSNAKSGVLFLKNNEPYDLIISGFFNMLGTITGTISGDLLITYEFNTAGGTLIAATSNIILPTNKKIGSISTPAITALYGAQGLTVDSGLNKISSLSSATSTHTLPIRLSLPQGTSVAVSIKPFTGTTSMSLIASLNCFLHTREA